MRYEVLAITTAGERVVTSLADESVAFDTCVAQWGNRRAGGLVYAVRDTQTDQRWSFRDIQDLRAPMVLA